jgi:exosortase
VWWRQPDASHALLLVPLALVLAARTGVAADARPQRVLGLAILVSAVLLRYMAGLAAELFTMNMAALIAAVGLIVHAWGARQLMRWWLPAALIFLSVPLPEIVVSSLALPLQFKASQLGAAMLASRHVPVELAGNVIELPNHRLFVTEACSGLRSLSALIALGLLIGGLWLRSPLTRGLLVLGAVPIAMLLNGVRIFLTGFFVYFVDPGLGRGLMHYTEGWVMFVAAFTLLGGLAWLLARVELLRSRGRLREVPA